MSKSLEDVYSIGQIAEILQCPVFKVEYLIRSRKIGHIRLIGHSRVFSGYALKKIQEAMNSDLRKKGSNHA